MTYPISIIPYANMAPFIALGPPRGCKFFSYTPRQSTIALKEGKIWAAPIPVGDLPAIENNVTIVGNLGVAARGAVKSVLLFSNRPFDEMSAAKIYLTDQSSSSVRLLYLLLGYRLGFDRLPLRTAYREEADGELLIGDEALIRAAKAGNQYITDLADLWYRIHNRSFVFARWVIH